MELIAKLEILADAAKYDASCASSGAPKRRSDADGGLGATTGKGICHAFTPDGRCIALLKVLLTNACIYDCQYCVNRRSSSVPRARFTVEELANLTADFYRRNYIDGLFLSSGIVGSPDATMEQLVRVARTLRETHDFRGYIHLKTIPDASPELIDQAGRWADRLSVNVELPTDESLARLAPEKEVKVIRRAMGRIRLGIDARREDDAAAARHGGAVPPAFAPAGQSTQMIVGADGTDDRAILGSAETLYGAYGLKRVYYTAFSPIPQSPAGLPTERAPMVREHRLYQADWLLRHYGFSAGELFERAPDGRLATDIDPKLSWALTHRERFPVDLNAADLSEILRVPGIGEKSAKRIVELRRYRRVRWADLSRLRCDLKRARPFLVTDDHRPAAEASSEALRRALADPSGTGAVAPERVGGPAPAPAQMALF